MAIFLGNQGPHWPNPSSAIGTASFFGSGGGVSGITFLPGFSNDTAAGSSIKVTTASYSLTLTYYDNAGTQITTGYWSNGLTAADFSSANQIVSVYMDDADEVMYCLLMKTSSTPDEVALATVDKSGQIVQKAWRSFSTAGLDGAYSWGSLLRPGGDGSGDFHVIVAGAGVAPPRGKKYTIAVSDGAFTESTWLSAGGISTGFGNSSWYFSPQLGPTANNIYGRPRSNTSTLWSAQNKNPGGFLGNAATGNYIAYANYPNDDWAPGATGNTGGIIDNVLGWRGYYGFIASAGTSMMGWQFKMDDVHSMMDEMAVEYGIL